VSGLKSELFDDILNIQECFLGSSFLMWWRFLSVALLRENERNHALLFV